MTAEEKTRKVLNVGSLKNCGNLGALENEWWHRRLSLLYVDLHVAAILPAQRVVCMSSPIHLLHCYGLFFFLFPIFCCWYLFSFAGSECLIAGFFFFFFQFFAVGIYFLWLVQSVKLQSFFFLFSFLQKRELSREQTTSPSAPLYFWLSIMFVHSLFDKIKPFPW